MSAVPDIADPVIRVRRPLARTAAALARGHLTLGFLGGSITDAKTGTRWPEPFVARGACSEATHIPKGHLSA